jgi:hypothetical protein
LRVYNEPPLKDETTGAFGARLHALLWAKWEKLTIAEAVNAIVLHRLTSYDQSVERVALTNDIQTRNQFLQEMRAFSHARKRPAPSSNNLSVEPGAKQRRSSDFRVKCHYCGVLGHRAAECRTRKRAERPRDSRRQGGNHPATSSHF